MSSKELIEVIVTWTPYNLSGVKGVNRFTRIEQDNTYLIRNNESRRQVEEYFKSGYGEAVYLIVGEV